MATSYASICSTALMELGDLPITSLTDSTTRARLCNQFFPDALDAVLSDHPWDFATDTAVLAQSVDTISWAGGTFYKYALPADFLRLNETDKDEYADALYNVEGQFIITEDSSMTIKYVFRCTNPNQFSPLFTQALIAYMKYKLAGPIKSQVDTTVKCWELYQGMLQAARTADGMQGTPDTWGDDTLVNVRL